MNKKERSKIAIKEHKDHSWRDKRDFGKEKDDGSSLSKEGFFNSDDSQRGGISSFLLALEENNEGRHERWEDFLWV